MPKQVMRNQTSEVEARVLKLFLVIRELVNVAVKAAKLPRVIAESTSDPHGVLFHCGNRPANLATLTGPNIVQGKCFTLIYPDGSGVSTKRQCATCFFPPGVEDDFTAAAVLFSVSFAVLKRINKGTENLAEHLAEVAVACGITKTGKLSQGLRDTIAAAVKDAGPWPVPGITVKGKKKSQGHRGPVKAFCAGLMNEDGNPCMVENEQAKPSRYWRAFHPGTADLEIPTATCHFCGGPLMKKADYDELRKNAEVEVEVTL